MVSKKYNRKIISVILYAISFIVISTSTFLLVHTLSCGHWKLVSVALLFLANGLIVLLVAINRDNDITIDYTNKEVLSNIKFDKTANICVPFDSIINVYICNSNQINNEIQSKKHPSQTLVIEQRGRKVNISLKLFDKNTVNALVEDLLKVRDMNE